MQQTEGDRADANALVGDPHHSYRLLEVPMFNPTLAWGRYRLLLGPLVAAIVAGAIVVGAALAMGSSSSSSTTADSGAITPGLALQGAIVKVVQSVSPSVVQIQDQVGLGSGIVLDASGYIVTNNHVVTGAKSLTVTTSNGRQYPAKLVGSFPSDDLAVIKISGADLKAATFGDSSKLNVGDLAIAIGNPLGLRSSVTDGIVSAFRQDMSEGSNGVTLPSVIQTSAAINPGNSGGALVDIQGRVIGIPTLAATDPQLGGSAPGIGFAIPGNLAKDIASQIVTHGKVVNYQRAYLGTHVGETSGNGLYVGSVSAGGPAANAGIDAGDVIVSVDGYATSTINLLSSVLAGLKPGQQVSVVVKHQDGRQATLQVMLGAYPGS
ncbi:MAG: trypsin-like peptidase domain-containing protein [Actinomycetota bacterium]|nr:trypsin-like peptidase domain-containing protein [Actinomycetota bacterium]